PVERSIIAKPTGRLVHAQAYWSRTRGRHASSTIDSRGPEERAVAIIIFSIAQHIIETKEHLDPIAEVLSSEEIDGRQTGQQRQDQAQRLCASGLHAADRLSCLSCLASACSIGRPNAVYDLNGNLV